MPKSRTQIVSSTTTATITIPSSILQLNQYQRKSTSSTPHYIHNTSYGLLEPVAQSQAIPRPSLHHRRKSSSSTSQSWSDRGFDLLELKDKGVDLGGKISEKLPGVRYSAAFISDLRANLALSASLALPSPNLLALSPNLPPIKSFSAEILDPPSLQQSRRMVIGKDPDSLDRIPELTFSPPKTPEDRIAGLKLVADILSQQRSTASKALIYNPVTLAIWVALVALVFPWVYRNPATDKPNLAIMVIGMIMFVLACIRYLVKPYQDLAEQINWSWLGDDEMVIAKYGGTVIGSCVYRVEGSNGKKNSSSRFLLIRAWTTRPRERARGIGRGVLEKLVDVAKQKNCQSIEFAPDEIRAGSTRLLTRADSFGGWFGINASFDKDEQRARAMLDSVLDELWAEKRNRGSR